MKRQILLLLTTLVLITFSVSSCTKSGGGEERSGSSNDSFDFPTDTGSDSFGDLRTSCGTVVGGKIKNPVSSDEGTPVSIIGAGTSGTVVILREQGPQLLRLRGISQDPNPIKETRAMDLINNFSSSVLLYTDNCSATTSDGGQAIVGDLLTTSGTSLTEHLIERSAVDIDLTGECSTSLVAGCYDSLLESNTPISFGSTVSNFLWKPSSERNGNLVVLLNPGGTTIIVNDTVLKNEGASNGRGTTARANKPGAAFGSNIRVEVYDSLGRPLAFPNGETFLIIKNGSQRVEIR